MKKIIRNIYLLFLLLFLFGAATADATGYYFYVQLGDKSNSPYSISHPEAYLSARALERRAYYFIDVDSTDLPVSPVYEQQIRDLGIHIHCRTKWLNGLTVLVPDSNIMSQVRALPFVKFVQYTGLTDENKAADTRRKVSSALNFDYGAAATQINQLNGSILHNNGFRGENIHIAVLDAGFLNVDLNPAFDSLRTENRLLGTKDFVNPASDIYSEDSHGAYVLSTMTGNIPGKFLGTAPKASYLLIRTEADEGEYLCEPDFWVSGIEYADSAGVDLATTSLGYTEFDDSTMNYTYADMDGKTARASIAATMAFRKGIMLLNSAGNDGSNGWHYIGVPADADGVITVGSVTKTGTPSWFSSFGPSYDGRIKPELCATGTSSSLVSYADSVVINGSGTSFACPILAGMTACYLQAAKAKAPSHTLLLLRRYLTESGNLYNTPTDQMGYGIPDFAKAYTAINNTSVENIKNECQVKLLVNSTERKLKIRILDSSLNLNKAMLVLYSISGQAVLTTPIKFRSTDCDIASLRSGIYLLTIEEDGIKYRNKILIR